MPNLDKQFKDFVLFLLVDVKRVRFPELSERDSSAHEFVRFILLALFDKAAKRFLDVNHAQHLLDQFRHLEVKYETEMIIFQDFFFRRLSTFIKSSVGNVWVFRCVRQERISIRGPVRPSVRPSVLCKNRVSWLFLATVRSYTETNDQPTCFESLFTRLFVHLSLHTYVT